jgi:hypothetical protein
MGNNPSAMDKPSHMFILFSHYTNAINNVLHVQICNSKNTITEFIIFVHTYYMF